MLTITYNRYLSDNTPLGVEVQWSIGSDAPDINPFHIQRIVADGDEAKHISACFSSTHIDFKTNAEFTLVTIPWNKKSLVQVWYGSIARMIYECLND